MKRIILPLLLLVLESARLCAQPVITNQPVNQAVIWGGNATFSVMATDVGPLTYQWQLNGTNLPNNLITTVAGGNLFNNQPATNAILNNASGIAQDSAGNLFFSDTGNHVIRKVDPNGITTIVAGNGNASFSGDGGAAINAGLYFPHAVAMDASGNLLIADSANNRIRKVDTNGVITTVAGTGSSGFFGDGGAATNAKLSQPLGLCLDKIGNLFIADSLNARIRKVGTNGIITTVAGNGVITLLNPSGVAADISNNVYIADSSHNRILLLNSIGNISMVAGTGTSGYSGDGGLATSAKLNIPRGVMVDAARNLFIMDYGNNRVRKLGTNNIITTVAGTGTNGFAGDGGAATNANLSTPLNALVDSLGNLFIADFGNNRIRKVDTNGVIITVAGRNLNDGDFATNATFNVPYGIVFDPVGNLYIADANNSRVRKVDTNGVITTVAGNGFFAFAGNGGAATNGSLKLPGGIALDVLGNLFIADYGDNRIRKVDTNGIFSSVAGTGAGGLYGGDGGAATNALLWSPRGVAVDSVGNVYIADTQNNLIRKVNTNGVITRVAGNSSAGFSGDGLAATSAVLAGSQSVAIDSIGNLFIADSSNNRIRKVDTNGIINTIAGNGGNTYSGDGALATNASIRNPTVVMVDSIGNFFIADNLNQRIRKVGTNGIITTLAGNGIVGFSGDGGTGSNASLCSPQGLAMDGAGNVYISDSGNNRIRKLAYLDNADQPSFTLTNVTLDSVSNNYSVIVTSTSGSVTSSAVTVTLQLSPITPTLTSSNGVCTFTWSAVSNLTYQLQYNLDLTTTNWIDLGSPITATNNSISTTDVVGPDIQRFYRVRLVP